MKIEGLHIGMKVRHPQYGVGVVKTISEATADIQFDDGRRTVAPEPSGLEPAEAQASIRGLEMPLAQVVQLTVDATIHKLGLERPESVVEQLAARWHKGRAVLHPADPALQTKEVSMEVFFHKVVGIRNQLRVLEQKINAPPDFDRRGESGYAAIHHTLLRFADDVQFAVQGEGRSILTCRATATGNGEVKLLDVGAKRR